MQTFAYPRYVFTTFAKLAIKYAITYRFRVKIESIPRSKPMPKYLRQRIARKIADTRSDVGMSQADLEEEISTIISRLGALKVLRDFVAKNIAYYRIKAGHTLTTLPSSIEEVESKLRKLGYNSGAALDKSKLSKTEQLDGRTCPAEELYVIASALKRTIQSFFPPEAIYLTESEANSLEENYILIDNYGGIVEYKHRADPNKIAVVFVAEGMRIPSNEVSAL